MTPAKRDLADQQFRSVESLREFFSAVDAADLPFHGADICLVLPVLQRHGDVALRAWQYFCRRGQYHTTPREFTVSHFILKAHDWIEWSAPADITQSWR